MFEFASYTSQGEHVQLRTLFGKITDIWQFVCSKDLYLYL
jgi:hypothetical protein